MQKSNADPRLLHASSVDDRLLDWHGRRGQIDLKGSSAVGAAATTLDFNDLVVGDRIEKCQG